MHQVADNNKCPLGRISAPLAWSPKCHLHVRALSYRINPACKAFTQPAACIHKQGNKKQVTLQIRLCKAKQSSEHAYLCKALPSNYPGSASNWWQGAIEARFMHVMPAHSKAWPHESSRLFFIDLSRPVVAQLVVPPAVHWHDVHRHFKAQSPGSR